MTAAARAGVEPAGGHWFDRGAPSRLDRMPLFGEAMASVALAWTDGFAPLSAAEATFSFTDLSDGRVSALAGRRGPDPVFAVLNAPAWSTAIGLQFDRAFVSAIVEALFGGGEAEGGSQPSGPLSAVETRIAEVVAGQAADALRRGFAEVLPSPFVFDRIQPKPDPSFLGRPNTQVVIATLRLDVSGQLAEIDVLVPRAALDVFTEQLAVLPGDEPAGTDPRWSERLETEVSSTPVGITAVIALPLMTLGDLARLAVGQVLALPRNAANDVRLICEGRHLFRCDLGQSADHYTVRVEEPATLAQG